MTLSKDIAIKLTNVSKKYTIHHEKPTLVEKFINGKDEEFWALKDINLEIKKGEKVGIIGPNGCGKTTLLKLITSISTATRGKVLTNGKIVSLIDLEAGFQADLTGIQNIYLNGMILGMTKSEIEKKLQEIINFADIRQFIDVPLYTYSQGMKLRLGFSIAISSSSDTLILDENIDSGDQNFKIKSYRRLQEDIRNGKTIILASHSMVTINNIAKRVIWINSGEIFKDGPPHSIISNYEKSNK